MKINQFYEVESLDAGKRIDTYLALQLVNELSRSQLKKYIFNGQIKLNGASCKPHTVVKLGDKIHVDLVTESDFFAEPEEIPLNIVFEDKDLIVLNKPQGMVVHPANGNMEHTLVNALLYHVGKQLTELNEGVRPGIVHRLDKDTSGLMMVAKNETTHAALSLQIQNRTVGRTYWVVVKGIVQRDEGECQEPIGRAFLNRKKVIIKPTGGKSAHTFFKVIRRYKKSTLLEVKLKTGRTHQIRVHMAHLGHPVLGDSLYGIQSKHISRQALHSKSLTFKHPHTKERLSFDSEVPEDMKYLIEQLEKEEKD